jgi:hypothetical protein
MTPPLYSSRLVVAASVAAFALVAVLPARAAAQGQPALVSLSSDTLSPLQLQLACAHPPTESPSQGGLHVVGSQDTMPRDLLDSHDLLILDGGIGRGVQIGQEYYVRHIVTEGAMYGPSAGRPVETAGWIKVVSANQETAIAAVEHVCTAIDSGDYLEPFTAPAVPAGTTSVDRSGEPDFSALGRVLYGRNDHYSAATGEYMTIDRGADQGMTPGTRLAIYRNVKRDRANSGVRAMPLPLSWVGEAVVVSTSPKLSVVKIMDGRDAVFRDDYVAPRVAPK